MSRENRLRVVTAVVVVALVGLACGPFGGSSALSAVINSPPSGTTVTVGEVVEITSTATADAGVARVELSVNGQMVRTDAPPGATPESFSVVQTWTPVAAGTVTVSVVAYDTEGAASEAATISLTVEVGVAAAMPTPVDDVEGPGGCTLNVSYVGDVTIPDDTAMAPGTSFTKTWRVRNSGTCDWGSGFTLVFASGDQMGGPASVVVPPTTAGSNTDLSVGLAAPGSPGTYRGNWRVQSDAGAAFGSTIYVQIVVPEPTAEATAEPTAEPTSTPEPEAEPVEVDIPADQDTYWWPPNVMCMIGSCPDFGGGPELSLSNTSTGSGDLQIFNPGRIALHFDLGGIPVGATIQDATLHLYLDSADGEPSATLRVRRATSPWSEGDHGVEPVCESGGETAERSVGSGSGWYDWNVTAIVAHQYANPTTNYGFCLTGGKVGDLRVFRSREAAGVTGPYLRVTYLP